MVPFMSFKQSEKLFPMQLRINQYFLQTECKMLLYELCTIWIFVNVINAYLSLSSALAHLNIGEGESLLWFTPETNKKLNGSLNIKMYKCIKESRIITVHKDNQRYDPITHICINLSVIHIFTIKNKRPRKKLYTRTLFICVFSFVVN